MKMKLFQVFLGENERLHMLSGFGKILVRILNFIDPNHALNSIEENNKR